MVPRAQSTRDWDGKLPSTRNRCLRCNAVWWTTPVCAAMPQQSVSRALYQRRTGGGSGQLWRLNGNHRSCVGVAELARDRPIAPASDGSWAPLWAAWVQVAPDQVREPTGPLPDRNFDTKNRATPAPRGGAWQESPEVARANQCGPQGPQSETRRASDQTRGSPS